MGNKNILMSRLLTVLNKLETSRNVATCRLEIKESLDEKFNRFQINKMTAFRDLYNDDKVFKSKILDVLYRNGLIRENETANLKKLVC